MSRVPRTGISLTQAFNITTAALLGVLTAIWVDFVLGNVIGSFPAVFITVLALSVGGAAGLLPVAVKIAETPRTQLLLLYLSVAFLTGLVIFVWSRPDAGVFAAGAMALTLVIGSVYFRSTRSGHHLFVGVWVCLLAAFITGLAGLIDVGASVLGMFPAIVVAALLLIMIGTHQVLIDEREHHMS